MSPPSANDILDEDDPLWLINEQIKGLLEGIGADEDHRDVLNFLHRATGLPEGTIRRIHRAIVHGDIKVLPEQIGTPDAQPGPSAQDESVRKAWARFSNAIVSGDDAPYPEMAAAFEQHFSQSFTDRAWRAESGTWAAAWKAAKRHEAQPVRPALNAIAEAIIDDLQAQHNTELITEIDSGEALVRLSDAIAAVEDNFAQTQAEPSVPDDIMRDAMRYRFLRTARTIPISHQAARDPVVYDGAIDAAMFAAVQEDRV